MTWTFASFEAHEMLPAQQIGFRLQSRPKSKCTHFSWNLQMCIRKHLKYSVSCSSANIHLFVCVWSSEICIIAKYVKRMSLFSYWKDIFLLVLHGIWWNLSLITAKACKTLKLSSLRSRYASGALFVDIWNAMGKTKCQNAKHASGIFGCFIIKGLRPTRRP